MKKTNILIVVGIIILILTIVYLMFEIIVIENEVSINEYKNTLFNTHILELINLESQLRNNEISSDEYEKNVEDASENFIQQIESIEDMKKSLGIFYN